MEQMATEEWDRILQEWINQSILKQEHCVSMLMDSHGGLLLIKIFVIVVICQGACSEA